MFNIMFIHSSPILPLLLIYNFIPYHAFLYINIIFKIIRKSLLGAYMCLLKDFRDIKR